MGTSVLESPQTVETAIETMRAVVVHSFDVAPRVEEVAKPVAGSNEIVVKIEASGLCHTDIHAAHGARQAKAAVHAWARRCGARGDDR